MDFVEKLQKAQFKRRLIEAIITAVFLAIAITIQILYDNSKIASAVDESFFNPEVQNRYYGYVG